MHAVSSTPRRIVHCRGVTRNFGGGVTAVRALRGVDLDVLDGELLLLAGPSGCGKTTLLSIVGAMLQRDAGECVVLGQDPQALERDDRARFRGRALGFIFQDFNLLPTLTAHENVAVPLLIDGMPRRAALRRASDMLDAIGLGARSASRPSELSGGQQQRVAIARALVRDPGLVLCDEPTSHLDHDAGKAMLELLRRTGRANGRALVVATHDSRIFGYADRIAHMDDGRIVSVTAGPGQETAP